MGGGGGGRPGGRRDGVRIPRVLDKSHTGVKWEDVGLPTCVSLSRFSVAYLLNILYGAPLERTTSCPSNFKKSSKNEICGVFTFAALQGLFRTHNTQLFLCLGLTVICDCVVTHFCFTRDILTNFHDLLSLLVPRARDCCRSDECCSLDRELGRAIDPLQAAKMLSNWFSFVGLSYNYQLFSFITN